MAYTIYMGGVPGVGKTTTGKNFCKSVDDYVYVSSGEYKRPKSEELFGKKLSLLNQKESYKINQWFFEDFLAKNKNSENYFLIDTHYTYPYPQKKQKFVKLCPPNIAQKLDLLILLEATPEEIIRRRIARGRDRDYVEPLQLVEIECLAELTEAKRLSEKYKIPLERFSTETEQELVLDTLRNVLNKYFH